MAAIANPFLTEYCDSTHPLTRVTNGSFLLWNPGAGGRVIQPSIQASSLIPSPLIFLSICASQVFVRYGLAILKLTKRRLKRTSSPAEFDRALRQWVLGTGTATAPHTSAAPPYAKPADAAANASPTLVTFATNVATPSASTSRSFDSRGTSSEDDGAEPPYSFDLLSHTAFTSLRQLSRSTIAKLMARFVADIGGEEGGGGPRSVISGASSQTAFSTETDGGGSAAAMARHALAAANAAAACDVATQRGPATPLASPVTPPPAASPMLVDAAASMRSSSGGSVGTPPIALLATTRGYGRAGGEGGTGGDVTPLPYHEGTRHHHQQHHHQRNGGGGARGEGPAHAAGLPSPSQYQLRPHHHASDGQFHVMKVRIGGGFRH